MKQSDYTPIEPIVVAEEADDMEVEVIADDVEYLPDPPEEITIELPGEEEEVVDCFPCEDETLAYAEELREEDERRRRETEDDLNNLLLMGVVCFL